jgi:hypothetical protein
MSAEQPGKERSAIKVVVALIKFKTAYFSPPGHLDREQLMHISQSVHGRNYLARRKCPVKFDLNKSDAPGPTNWNGGISLAPI